MRIGLKKMFYKKKKTKQYAHTKSFARLVDSENWSKKMYLQKNNKKQYAHTKSVASLVDSENWFKKNVLQKEKNKTIRPHKKFC